MEYLTVSIYIENFPGISLKKTHLLPLNLCLYICLNEETPNKRTLLPTIFFIILL